MDTAAAQSAEGVVGVMTPANAPKLPQGGKAAVSIRLQEEFYVLQDNRCALQQSANCSRDGGNIESGTLCGFTDPRALSIRTRES